MTFHLFPSSSNLAGIHLHTHTTWQNKGSEGTIYWSDITLNKRGHASSLPTHSLSQLFRRRQKIVDVAFDTKKTCVLCVPPPFSRKRISDHFSFRCQRVNDHHYTLGHSSLSQEIKIFYTLRESPFLRSKSEPFLLIKNAYFDKKNG